MADKISITICGDGGCGKSSITLRLVRSQWTHDYDPTIEDYYSVTRTIDGLSYHLSLTDTAGQEEYRPLWASSNLSSDAFLLVYDLTNPSSFDTLSHYMEMIDIETEHRMEENASLLKGDGGVLGDKERRLIKPMPVKIVAGNKCDLKAERRVSSRHGLEWARSRGCGFMETSAREMVNIEETFALIVRRVIQSRQQSALQPFSANPTLNSNIYPYNSNPLLHPQEPISRASIMHLTKENALKAASGRLPLQSPNNHHSMLSPTRPPVVDLEKPLPDPSYGMDANAKKDPRGPSTRLDGRPDKERRNGVRRRKAKTPSKLSSQSNLESKSTSQSEFELKSTLESESQSQIQLDSRAQLRPKSKSRMGSWIAGLSRLRCTVGWEEVESENGRNKGGKESGNGGGGGSGSGVGQGSGGKARGTKVEEKF